VFDPGNRVTDVVKFKNQRPSGQRNNMFHKWKLVKSVSGESVSYLFSAKVDENTVVDTLAFEVENGDELSALIALCDYAREAWDPRLGDSSFSLENVIGMARRGEA
jgi:hypothetical protein